MNNFLLLSHLALTEGSSLQGGSPALNLSENEIKLSQKHPPTQTNIYQKEWEKFIFSILLNPNPSDYHSSFHQYSLLRAFHSILTADNWLFTFFPWPFLSLLHTVFYSDKNVIVWQKGRRNFWQVES